MSKVWRCSQIVLLWILPKSHHFCFLGYHETLSSLSGAVAERMEDSSQQPNPVTCWPRTSSACYGLARPDSPGQISKEYFTYLPTGCLVSMPGSSNLCQANAYLVFNLANTYLVRRSRDWTPEQDLVSVAATKFPPPVSKLPLAGLIPCPDPPYH